MVSGEFAGVMAGPEDEVVSLGNDDQSLVFPTNGHANPTYTIVALAVRMADHLKETLKNRV